MNKNVKIWLSSLGVALAVGLAFFVIINAYSAIREYHFHQQDECVRGGFKWSYATNVCIDFAGKN